jgi:hypothetical protein
MSLKELIASDIKTIFLKDDLEFADALTIGTSSNDTIQTFGSLQSNLIENNAGNANALQMFSWILYVSTEDIESFHFRVGQTMYINNTAYKIQTISDEMGVSTIGLKKGA